MPPLQPEFDWDEHNEEKLLSRHGVTAAEVEECFANRHTRRRDGEAHMLLGRTHEGRMLFVVYAIVEGRKVRPYSARNMTSSEERLFRRKVR